MRRARATGGRVNRARTTGARVVLALLLLAATGCLYGFAGGGLPPHVKTVAVLPFDNQTASVELQRELSEGLRRALEQRLGLREAPEATASAVVKGAIVTYEIDVPVAISANPAQATTSNRRLRVVVRIELIDQVSGKTLWKGESITAEGEYTEGNEAQGRRQAIDRIINDVIEGAQSQW